MKIENTTYSVAYWDGNVWTPLPNITIPPSQYSITGFIINGSSWYISTFSDPPTNTSFAVVNGGNSVEYLPFDLTINAITLYNDTIWIASTNGTYSWNGTSLQLVIPVFDIFGAVAAYEGYIYCTGSTFLYKINAANYSDYETIANYSETAFPASNFLNGIVPAIVFVNNSIYLGGFFETIDSSCVPYLAVFGKNNIFKIIDFLILFLVSKKRYRAQNLQCALLK